MGSSAGQVVAHGWSWSETGHEHLVCCCLGKLVYTGCRPATCGHKRPPFFLSTCSYRSNLLAHLTRSRSCRCNATSAHLHRVAWKAADQVEGIRCSHGVDTGWRKGLGPQISMTRFSACVFWLSRPL